MSLTWVSAGSLWLPEGLEGAGVGPGKLRRGALHLHVKTENKSLVDRVCGVVESRGATANRQTFLLGGTKIF